MTESPSGWTLVPAVERELRAARRGAILCRRLGWALFLTSIGACPLACLTFAPYAARPFPEGWAYGALALEIAIAFEWARRNVHDFDRRVARQRALKEEFAAAEGWTVEITIFQRAAPTGFDEGVVWFEDGHLYFVGRRTSFGIGRGRAKGVCDGLAIKGLRSAVTLDFRDGTSVGFDVVSADETPGIAQAHLTEILRRWFAGKGTDEGQGPSLAIGPDAPTASRLLVRALGSSALWCLGAGVVLRATFQWGWVGGTAALIAAILLGFFTPEAWDPPRRWRAWRDRRRLA